MENSKEEKNKKQKKPSEMMQHYLAVKEKYKDCFVFYRLGDFYEMFYDDAIKASELLDLTLTARDSGLEERAPDVRRSVSRRRYLHRQIGISGRKGGYLRATFRSESGGGRTGGTRRRPRRFRGHARRRYAARRNEEQLYRLRFQNGGKRRRRLGGYHDGRIFRYRI